MDKIVSGYQIIYGGQLDEDAMISKCKNTISCIEKVEKEIGGDIRSAGKISAEMNGLGVIEDFKGQHATLRDCIEQLSAMESSKINLISHLREALREQEMKLDQVRNELKAAHTQSEKADNLCRQLLNPGVSKLLPEQGTNTSKVHNYVAGSGEQSAAVVMYTRQIPVSEQSEENTKSAAAAVAAKLTASTSSAEMLSFVLSSLASEGVIGNSAKENEYPPEKRAKINENDGKIPQVAEQQPPLPSSPPPPLPPMPPMVPFMQTAGYGYSRNQRPYPSVGPPLINSGSSYTAPSPHGNQNYQIEGGFCSQPMTPMSRQY